MSATPEARFEAKVRVTDTGCLLWTGYIGTRGYGQFRDGKKVWQAHDWAYRRFVGPVEQELDHLCRNRACVNWWHLEDVSRAENVARIHKLQCRRGHPRTETNTRVRSDGCVQCLDCARNRQQKRAETA